MNRIVTLVRSAGRWLPRALAALAAGLAAVGGSYAAVGLTPRFVVAPVAKTVTVLMPGPVVAFAITELGKLGDQLALATAVGLAAGMLGAVALVGAALARRAGWPRLAAPFAGLATAALAAPIAGSPLSGAGAALGAATVVAVAALLPGGDATFEARREVLAGGATALGVGLLGLSLGHGRGAGLPSGAVPSTAPDEDQRAMLAAADERSLAVGGLEPLVSESFYSVDINQVTPSVDHESWSLSVTGAVEREASYDYEDLTSRPAEHRFVTLRCVGDDLNGGQIDTALWTGVPVADLVDPANPDGEYVMLRAADGYYEEFPAAALADALVAYEMNGEPLPRTHGFPARVLVPGHWGEINGKWVTEVEFLDEAATGYWEKRGWHGTGPVETVAKLYDENVTHLDDGRIRLAGHAYAGARGIERVEVSTDGGDTWAGADLSEPLPGRRRPGDPAAAQGGTTAAGDGSAPTDDGAADSGDGTATAKAGTPAEDRTPAAATDRATDAWRQWVYRYDPPDGPHEVVVRAVDRTGAVQPREESGSFPSGATGWVSRTVEP